MTNKPKGIASVPGVILEKPQGKPIGLVLGESQALGRVLLGGADIPAPPVLSLTTSLLSRKCVLHRVELPRRFALELTVGEHD